MKRAGFKIQPEKGGWLRTTLWPVNHRHDVPFFRLVDILMFFALVGLTVAIARVVLAH
jgi:hypothetical protein